MFLLTHHVSIGTTKDYPKPTRPASSVYSAHPSHRISTYTLPGNPFDSDSDEGDVPPVPSLPAGFRHQGPVVPPKLPLSPQESGNMATKTPMRPKTWRNENGERRNTAFYKAWDDILE